MIEPIPKKIFLSEKQVLALKKVLEKITLEEFGNYFRDYMVYENNEVAHLIPDEFKFFMTRKIEKLVKVGYVVEEVLFEINEPVCIGTDSKIVFLIKEFTENDLLGGYKVVLKNPRDSKIVGITTQPNIRKATTGEINAYKIKNMFEIRKHWGKTND